MTDIDLPGLAACPFCGGSAAESAQYPHVIVCADTVGCGAIGPNHFFKCVTREAWNTRAASAPDGVVVKPLEWVDTEQRGILQTHYYAVGGSLRHTVHPIDGTDGPFFEHYGIREDHREPRPWKLNYWVGNNGLSGIYEYFDTLDAAKAAAQTDYEQRIRSALVAAPQSFTSGHIAGQREIDLIAETIWRAEYRRATGRERLIPWSEVSPGDQERYRYVASAIASLPVSAGDTQSDNGGQAIIEGGAVVVRFPLDAMQFAVDGAWALRALDTRYKIADINEFSKEFVRALNREDEQGTTEIHKMADRAFIDCIENGAFGIEEHEQQDI